ncbi:MAG: ribonuclease P protein component [bacterium]
MKKFGFSGQERLKNTIDYNRVIKKGERITHPYFYLFFIRNNLFFDRLGIRIGKKFGKAHVRNKTKRIIKEIYRQNKSLIPGFDLVFIPRYGAKYIFSNVETVIKKVFLQLRDSTTKPDSHPKI